MDIQAPISRRAALAAGLAITAAPVIGRAQPPGLLVAGGPIYTGLGDGERVEAVAIRGDRIVFTGSLAEARGRVPGARQIDLAGAAAYPGFVDCHAHLAGIGLRELTLDLTGVGSVGELRARLAAWATAHPRGPIVGAGWIETHWPEARFPTAADLDTVVADRPVALSRADGHALVANSAAIALAGVTASTGDPRGGEILRRPDGAPAGLFVDNAMDLVRARLPRPDRALKARALGLADALYRSRGWTGAHAMSMAADELDILRGSARAGALGLRVDAYMDVDSADEVLATGPSADPTGRVRLRGVKLYADGALGSRGAALLAPYSDKPGWMGLLVTPPEQIVAVMRRAKAAGAQAAVHAIGDRGNRLTLDAIEQVLGPARTDRRWRIEHAQILSPQDLPRFAAMGVTASMQPSHAIGDLYFAPARLGSERLKGAYAWRSLLESGAVVCGGSDAPVEKGDPRIEFYAAAWRHALDGYAGPDWGLDQALGRAAALRLFTRSAAYAISREADLGTLEPGKLADITAFSHDFMTAEPSDILKARPAMAMIAGQLPAGA